MFQGLDSGIWLVVGEPQNFVASLHGHGQVAVFSVVNILSPTNLHPLFHQTLVTTSKTNHRLGETRWRQTRGNTVPYMASSRVISPALRIRPIDDMKEHALKNPPTMPPARASDLPDRGPKFQQWPKMKSFCLTYPAKHLADAGLTIHGRVSYTDPI